MTAPGLFAEPERVPMPTADGQWSIAPTGWRYMLLGEDGENLLMQGHVDDRAVTEVLAALPDWYGVFSLDEVGPPEKVWARELTKCPTHAPKDADDACALCHATSSEPIFVWSSSDDDPNVNRFTEDTFPATVITLDV